MKKFLFIAIALFAFACSKEEAEPTAPQLHPVTINVADFPTTRADVYGKTTWEKGDKLWIEIKLFSAETIFDEDVPIYLHPITFNGSAWLSESPLYLPEFDFIDLYVTYCPNMEMTWLEDEGTYFLEEATDETPYLNEFLTVNIFEEYGDNLYYNTDTNTLKIAWDSDNIGRNNRIRINYKPNTEIKVAMESVTYAVRYDYLAPEIYTEDYEDVEFNVTTDADGNAFIFAMWYPGIEESLAKPSITILNDDGSKILKDKVNLPYKQSFLYPFESEAGGRAYVLTVPQE